MAMKTFAPPFFNHFSLCLNRKKTCGNESHEKEIKHIHASAVDLLHTRIGDLDWCKCRHCRNKVREINCIFYIEVDAILIASTKILDCEGSISPSNFYGQLSDY